MLHLDGSYGEGGGQILRTSLSLSAWLRAPVRIERIRAGRPKPGLRPQHLTAVKALARISGAEVEGAELNSRELTFKPRTPKPGNYLFDVAEKTGSAGSVTLIAQALLPPLLKSAGPSSVILRGGTHVPWSPTAHYLKEVFLPALAELGARVSLDLPRWGWYPRGGGEMRLSVQPCPGFKGVEWRTAPEPHDFQALSAISHLPEHVTRRQAARLKERLGPELPVELVDARGRDPGSLVFIWGPRAGFSALGARGKPAEQVADEAAYNCFIFRMRRAAVDPHLADQIVLYLSQAQGPSVLVTSEITLHLLTNLWVIEQFLGPLFVVRGNLGERGEVFCQGR
ncbi:MAG: RNA 3'-terminal phosphate cyclase [Deltaproteobacteria bacterium]|nr:RNA 3'-terminal phosphate cyclase [Deltaproteobacteria bacterium]